MGDDGFETWLSMIGRLDGSQQRRALRALALAQAADGGTSDDASDREGAAARPTPPASAPDESRLGKLGRDRIESFGCPHCSSAERCRWGCASGKTFNPLTGTPPAVLHHQERWADQARALIAGDTVSKAAERCRIAYTTAFRWRHRFLAALNLDKLQRLSGIIEAHQTFVLVSFNGKRGRSSERIPVLVARDRSGATIDAVLPHLDIASMTAVLGQAIARGSELCCDGGKAISEFAGRARIKMHVLAAPGAPMPNAPQFHIITVYHSRLKEWMRLFYGVATDKLPNDLSWRPSIEALSNAATPESWIRAAARLGPYQQSST